MKGSPIKEKARVLTETENTQINLYSHFLKETISDDEMLELWIAFSILYFLVRHHSLPNTEVCAIICCAASNITVYCNTEKWLRL